MKQFMLGALKKVSDFLLVISILSALAGLVITMIPELIETFGLNLNPRKFSLDNRFISRYWYIRWGC